MTRPLATLLALLLCAGCAAKAPPEPPTRASYVALSYDLTLGADDWAKAAAERFENPLVVAVHGQSEDGKNWYVVPTRHGRIEVNAFLNVVEAFSQGRPVVLTSCNEGAVKLHGHPNVWYARKVVWSSPGPTTRMASSTKKIEHWVGSIWDFEEAK